MLFGDGAGAVVLTRRKRREFWRQIACRRFASRHPQRAQSRSWRPGLGRPVRAHGRPGRVQDGGAVMADVCNETLAMANMTAADIDWLVPHQANVHHRRHQQTPRHRAGEDHRHHAGARATRRRRIDSFPRSTPPFAQHASNRAGGADGGRRWRIYLGQRADPLVWGGTGAGR